MMIRELIRALWKSDIIDTNTIVIVSRYNENGDKMPILVCMWWADELSNIDVYIEKFKYNFHTNSLFVILEGIVKS